ncbi:MAG: class I SAM-dependent methyltransferase [Ignavibacteria bacterium]|nr:class I SAM-dependent methyltransferase [Ignavibacteria bacterium]
MSLSVKNSAAERGIFGDVATVSTPALTDLAQQVESMDLHARTKRNFRMQYRLATHTLIPWLDALNILRGHAAVCEIGCGEGGVVSAFAQRGASFALGTDIMGALLDQISSPLAEKLGLRVTFAHHDVIGAFIPDVWLHRFDVVVLRDVIEHLDNPEQALRNIHRLVAPGGTLLITFPPYTSPFGGHQQLLGTFAGSIPFVHLLPTAIFNAIVERGDPMNRDEVKRLHSIRCSADRIMQAAKNEGFNIIDEKYYGLRPVFRWKYNKHIPVFELSRLKKFSFVRDLAMEAAFVFKAGT